MQERADQLHRIRDNILNLNGPIVIGGDFNCITNRSEKEGGNPPNPRALADFLAFILDLQLIDVGFTGPIVTWSNKKKIPADVISCRLDRFLISPQWLDAWPETAVNHINTSSSDHLAIHLQCTPRESPTRRLFRFDARWINNDEVRNIILNSWHLPTAGLPMFKVVSKLKRLRHKLFEWVRAGTSNSARKIRSLEEKIAEEKIKIPIDWEIVVGLETELGIMIHQEELYWKQRYRTKWNLDGDRNTKFFHQAVAQQRRRNKVESLIDSNGVARTAWEEMGEILINFYSELFTSSLPPSDFRRRICSIPMARQVTVEMNEMLTAPVNGSDIKRAVFDIGPNKASGSDGFSGAFFQAYWDIIGSDVTEAIIIFFESEDILKSINHTWITLLPKVQKVENVRQLRPIGLCTVLYKIISKILTERLSKVLPHIISSTQNGFVHGRAISDNILIAHEVMHYLSGRKKSENKFMALKLDMEKAYDRVEWAFLFTLLRRFGFAEKWIGWIARCIMSTSMTIILNGQTFGFFKPTRGLRQGDPLSPLLFALCSERLTLLIEKAIASQTLTGVQINSHTPILTHLMFADDTFLFLRASVEEIAALKELFQVYELYSGQKLNLQKSTVTFCKATSDHDKVTLSNLLGVQLATDDDVYLGLPSVLKRSKVESFQFLEDVVAKRLQTWKGKFLSPAGMEVLLNSVVVALPVYAMGTYIIPKTTFDRINSLMANFWWGQTDSKRKIHWIEWEKLCKPKEQGGLGFRDFSKFNQALLAKQGWRILNNPDLLLSRVIKGRYFHDSTFFQAKLGYRPSHGWRSILHGRDILSKGCRWQIGNGQEIRTFKDPWIPNVHPSSLLQNFDDGSPLANCVVADFIFMNLWNVPKLMEAFPTSVVQKILSIPLPFFEVQDGISWQFSNSGAYTVTSGYELLSEIPIQEEEFGPSPIDEKLWKEVWSLETQPKLKAFLWKLFHGILPTRTALKKKIKDLPDFCPVCWKYEETIEHLLMYCILASKLATITGIPLNSFKGPNIVIAWREIMQKRVVSPQKVLIFWWRLWKSRNEVIFNFKQIHPKILKECFEAHLKEQEAIRNLARTQPTNQHHITDLCEELLPSNNWFRVNVDGAILKNKGGATGMVVRDFYGNLLFAGGLCFPFICDPFTIETLAVRTALLWIRTSNLQNLIIEGDAEQVHCRVFDSHRSHPLAGAIIQEIRTLLKRMPGVIYRTVKRTRNSKAHDVARFALNFMQRGSVMHNLTSYAIQNGN
ncbi:Putative ribonuclease H protein At1g65750 [Linum perenne]